MSGKFLYIQQVAFVCSSWSTPKLDDFGRLAEESGCRLAELTSADTDIMTVVWIFTTSVGVLHPELHIWTITLLDLVSKKNPSRSEKA